MGTDLTAILISSVFLGVGFVIAKFFPETSILSAGFLIGLLILNIALYLGLSFLYRPESIVWEGIPMSWSTPSPHHCWLSSSNSCRPRGSWLWEINVIRIGLRHWNPRHIWNSQMWSMTGSAPGKSWFAHLNMPIRFWNLRCKNSQAAQRITPTTSQSKIALRMTPAATIGTQTMVALVRCLFQRWPIREALLLKCLKQGKYA